jgi:hypothetical protein
MRSRFHLVTLIVLISCSKTSTPENRLTTDHVVDSSESILSTRPSSDSLSYIGYIQKFEDNNSFYTDLYFVNNFNYDRYDEVTKMADSVIFKDEETKRSRIPIEKARQYFNLTGLDNISIYNAKNKKLTTGRLHHIEYFEDFIEAKFIATFYVDDPNVTDYLFCIGNSKNEVATIDFTPYEDEKLSQAVIDHLNLKEGHIWSIDHYRFKDQTIYSTVSADTTAFIVETIDKTPKTLYKSESNETINGLTMVSHEIEGRPILLTDSGMPETDMTWNSVLIFNGAEYQVSKDHRIKGL